MRKANYLGVWIYLLISANHEDTTIIWNRKKTTIKAGSFIGSLHKISQHFGMGVATVKYIVDYFVSEHMIEHSPNRRFSVFTILKWNTYQGLEHSYEHKVNTKRTQGETNKNDKNEENDKKTDTEAVSNALALRGVIDLFKEVRTDYTKLFANKTERASAERLLTAHSMDIVARAVKAAVWANGQPYSGLSITKPTELERNWDKLVNFIRKEKAKGTEGSPNVLKIINPYAKSNS